MRTTLTPSPVPMSGIVDSRGGWPYPLVGELRRAGSRAWVEVTQAHYDEMHGALPPALYFEGGFMLGEAAGHDARGEPIYTAFCAARGAARGRYFARDCTKAELHAALADLAKAVTP